MSQIFSSCFTQAKRRAWARRVSGVVGVCFTLLTISPPAWALTPMSWSEAPVPVVSSSGAMLFGLQYDPQNPLMFEFFFDTSGLQARGLSEEEAQRHIKYFLAALALPEDEKWVNLSEDEPDRIVPDLLGRTAMGRDMLVQDYLLKTMTAGMLNPETEVGRRFWARVYERAAQRYGTTDVPVNTFNRVWIIPEKAVVYEKDGRGFVTDARLRVMLDEDRTALRARRTRGDLTERDEAANALGTEVVREVVLPELERAVNASKTFAPVREIYRAAVLAAWYKRSLRESVLGRLLADRGKIKGIDEADGRQREAVYEAYLKTIKEGVFNLVKLEEDPVTHNRILRRYFSGGLDLNLTGHTTQPPDSTTAGIKDETLEVRRGTPPASKVPGNAAAVQTAVHVKASDRYDDAVLSVLGGQLKPYVNGKVVLLHGAGKVGEKLLRAFLKAGTTVIVSETQTRIRELYRTYRAYVDKGHLFFVKEDPDERTKNFLDPFKDWGKTKQAVFEQHHGEQKVDIFVHAAVNSLDKEDIEALKKLGVTMIMGPANNILASPELAEELHREGIFYLPDVLNNFGGVMGAVGGFFGLPLDPEAMRRYAERLTEEVVGSALTNNTSPWAALQEKIKAYQEQLRMIGGSNREEAPTDHMKSPRRLKARTIAGRWTIEEVYVDAAQLPEAVKDAWDDHYAVFKLRDQQTQAVLFVAIHRLVQLDTAAGLKRLDEIRGRISEDDYQRNHGLLTRVNGHYYAVGGTRFMSYPSEEEALKDALRLARAMTFKNMAAGLPIGGSKNVLYIGPDKKAWTSPDRDKGTKLVVSSVVAVKALNDMLGQGGVVTGQDANITKARSDAMGRAAREVMIPHALPGLNLDQEDTSFPTAVASLAGMAAALKAYKDFDQGSGASAENRNPAKMIGRVPHREDDTGSVNAAINQAMAEGRVEVDVSDEFRRFIREARNGLIKDAKTKSRLLSVLFNPDNGKVWKSVTALMDRWYGGGEYPTVDELEKLAQTVNGARIKLVDNRGAPYLAMVDAENVQFAHVGNLRGARKEEGIVIYLPKALVEEWMRGDERRQTLLRILIQREMVIAVLGAYFQKKGIPHFDYEGMVEVLEQAAEELEKFALQQAGYKEHALDDSLKESSNRWQERLARKLSKKIAVWDREIAQLDEKHGKKIVGGKSYQVALMHARDPKHNLPSFSTTAHASIAFLKSKEDLVTWIEQKLLDLDTLDQSARDKLEKDIRNKIEHLPVPKVIEAELKRLYRDLVESSGQPLVAVRSSGRAEDIAIRSEALKHIVLGANAGQHDTYLGVQGEDEVVYYWRKAVSSLYTSRVLAYRDSIVLLKAFDELLQRKDLESIIHAVDEAGQKGDEPIKKWADDLVKALRNKDLSGISSFRMQRVLEAAGLKDLAARVQAIRRSFNGLDNIAMGVTVMPMANVDVSFVGFGHDLKVDHWTALSFLGDRMPPEEFLNRGRIFNVSFNPSLGEAIVAGLTTPDEFLVHVFEDEHGKHVNILERRLGAKEAQVVYIAPVIDELGLNRQLIDRWIAWLDSGQPETVEGFPRPQQLTPDEWKQLREQLRELVGAKVPETREKLQDGSPLLKLFGGDRDKIIKFVHLLKARREDPDTTTMLTEVPAGQRRLFSVSDEIVKKTALLYDERLAAGYGHLVDTEGAVGDNFGKRAVPLSTQRRPSNVVSDAHQGPVVSLSYTYIDPADAEKNHVLVKGVPTRNAFQGRVYPIDPRRELNEQFDDIRDMAKNDPVVIVTDETTPDYVPIMQMDNVVGVIAFTGGPTSHAAVVSRELGIATVVGVESYLKQLEQKDQHQAERIRKTLTTKGQWVTVDANADEQSGLGTVYEGQIEPRVRRLLIDLNRLPPDLQAKVGLIVGTTPPMRRVSKIGFYQGYAGVALMRGEFVYAEEGINPRFGIAFDHLLIGLALSPDQIRNDSERRAVDNFKAHVEQQKQWLEKGFIEEIADPLVQTYLDLRSRGYTAERYWSGLTPGERDDVANIRNAPQEIDALLTRIEGYSSYRSFFTAMHGGALATMAAANNRDRNVVIYRSIDFKKNEARELIGGTIFDPEPEDATMIGERGARWLLQPANQPILRQEIRVLLQAVADGYTNLGFMFPFVATPEELKELLRILHEEERAFSDKLDRPVYLREVGMMVELPSNVVLADQFAQILKQNETETIQWLKKRFGLSDDQIKRKSFFSFGTNDLTQTTLGADRDNPKMRSLFNEAHPFVIDSIRHVVLMAQRYGIKCELCGQALVNLQKTDPQAAEEILLLLGLTGGYGGTDYLGLPDAIARSAAVTLRHGILTTPPSDTPLATIQRSSLDEGAAARSFVVMGRPPELTTEEQRSEYFDRFHIESGEWAAVGEAFLDFLRAHKDRFEMRLRLAGAFIFDQDVTKEAFFDIFPQLKDKTPWLIVGRDGLAALSRIQQQYEQETLQAWREQKQKAASEAEQVALEWRKPAPPRVTIDFEGRAVYKGEGEFGVRQVVVKDPFSMPEGEASHVETDTSVVAAAAEFYRTEDRHPYDWVDNDPHALKQAWRAFLSQKIGEAPGKAVTVRTLDLTSSDLVQLKGHESYNPEKEINPPLGHFGLNALVSDEEGRRLLETEFRVLKEILDERAAQGQGGEVRLVLSHAKTPEAVREARTILEQAGITDEKIKEWNNKGLVFKVGINAAWPGNYLTLDEFIDQGRLDFVMVDERELAQGVLAAQLDGKNPNVRAFYHADKVRQVLKRPLAMIAGSAARKKVDLYLRRGDFAPAPDAFGPGSVGAAQEGSDREVPPDLNPIKITTSGYRDKIGRQGFNARNVYRLAEGIANALNKTSPQKKEEFFGVDSDRTTPLKILVTYGPRKEADRYARILAYVLQREGFEVALGSQITTTPASMAMTKPSLGEGRYHLAVHVDASHNPVTDLGVKFFAKGAVAPDALAQAFSEQANAIPAEETVALDEADLASLTVKSEAPNKQALERYVRIFGLSEMTKPGTVPTITVDPMHGGSGNLWSELTKLYPELRLTLLEARTVPLGRGTHPEFVEVDGREQPYRPEPVRELVDQRAFTEFKDHAPVGSLFMAVDGDADRLAVWVKSGEHEVRELSPNELGVLFAMFLIRSKTGLEGLPDGVKPTVVATLPTTQRLERLAGRYNLRFVHTPVGSKHFAPYVDQGLVIAVEESGHIVSRYKGEVLFDDAVGHALLLLTMLQEKSLLEWLNEVDETIGRSFYARVNLPLDETLKQKMLGMFENAEQLQTWINAVIEGLGLPRDEIQLTLKATAQDSRVVELRPDDLSDGLQRIKPLEGIKVEIRSRDDQWIGWFMVRFSGTEPVLRLYVEAPGDEMRKNLQTAVMKVSKIGPYAENSQDDAFGPGSVGAAQEGGDPKEVDRELIEKAVGSLPERWRSLLKGPVLVGRKPAPHIGHAIELTLLPGFLTDAGLLSKITFILLPGGVHDKRVPAGSKKIVSANETGETFVVVSSGGKATVFIDEPYFDMLRQKKDAEMLNDWLASVYAVAASFLYQQTRIRKEGGPQQAIDRRYEEKETGLVLESPAEVAHAVYEAAAEPLMRGHLVYLEGMRSEWVRQLKEGVDHLDGLLALLSEINAHIEFLKTKQEKIAEKELIEALEKTTSALKDLSHSIEEKIKGATPSASAGLSGPGSDGAVRREGSDTEDAPGGIDISDWLLPLQVLRDENGEPLPLEQQPLETLSIEGVVPVILDIRPVNLPMLLGLKEGADDEALPHTPGGSRGVSSTQQSRPTRHDGTARRWRKDSVAGREEIS